MTLHSHLRFDLPAFQCPRIHSVSFTQGKRILLATRIVRRALAEGKASSEGLPLRWNFAVLHGGALRVEAIAVISRVF
jgi:hypothetical protein